MMKMRRSILVSAAIAAGVLVAVVVVIVVVSGGTPPRHRGPTVLSPPGRLHRCPPAGCVSSQAQFFAPDSIWNQPVPADAPLDPNSAAIVNTLASEAANGPAQVQSSPYGVPIYTVGPSQPTVAVRSPNAQLSEALSAVPMPTDATPAAGNDAALAVYQPSSDTMWEFWRLVKHAPGDWSASWGGRMINVSSSPGYYQNIDSPSGTVLERASWGAPATSLALVGGVMTIAQLESGHIDHALCLAVGQPRAGVWAWPAQRTDGISTNPDSVPEGAHFRLDPRLNIASLHLPPFVSMMAYAAQKYGIVVNNQSGGVAFKVQDPNQFETEHHYNPYLGPDDLPGTPGALFDNSATQEARLFPWRYLQLLKMNLQTKRTTTVFTEPS